jgi:hypothetical protein
MMPDASTARAGLQRTRACSGCQGMRVLSYGTPPSRAAALSGVPQRPAPRWDSALLYGVRAVVHGRVGGVSHVCL